MGRIAVAKYDHPTSPELLLLKDELKANGIDFNVTGEEGQVGVYDSPSFAISVWVDEMDLPAAMQALTHVPQKTLCNRSADQNNAGQDDVGLDVGLQKIRRRRRAFWWVFFLYLPVLLLIAQFTRSEMAGWVCGILGMLLFVAVGWRVTTSKCPRCHKWFCSGRYHGNPFTGKCLNCGLRLRPSRESRRAITNRSRGRGAAGC